MDKLHVFISSKRKKEDIHKKAENHKELIQELIINLDLTFPYLQRKLSNNKVSRGQSTLLNLRILLIYKFNLKKMVLIYFLVKIRPYGCNKKAHFTEFIVYFRLYSTV